MNSILCLSILFSSAFVFDPASSVETNTDLLGLLSHSPQFISNNQIMYQVDIINTDYLQSSDNYPIVMFPPFLASIQFWYPLLNSIFNELNGGSNQFDLKKQSFILISPKGLGLSQVYPYFDASNDTQVSDTFSYDTQVSELLEILQNNLQLNGMNCFGYSYGAALCWKLLVGLIDIEQSDFMKKMLLTGTEVKNTVLQGPDQGLASLTEEIVELYFGSYRNFLYGGINTYLNDDSYTLDDIANLALSGTPFYDETFSLIKMMFTFDIETRLQDIKNAKVPVYIIQGTEDENTPLEDLDPLIEALNDDGEELLTLVELDGADHSFPHKESYHYVFIEAFRDFLFVND